MKYQNLQETHETCDDIWDFFNHEIILRTFWVLWNKKKWDQKILPKDFKLEDPQKLDFIREVLLDEEIQKEFLLILKRSSNSLKSKDNFPFNTQQITCFLLAWLESVERAEASSESLASIFSTRVLHLLEQIWSSEIELPAHLIDPEDESSIDSVRVQTWISTIIDFGYSPVNTDWNIIMATNTFKNPFSYEEVMNYKNGRVYTIDSSGQELSDEEITEVTESELEKLAEAYQKAIDFLKTWTKWHQAGDDILPIIAVLVESLELTDENEKMNKILIWELEKSEKGILEKIRERDSKSKREAIGLQSVT